MIRTNSKHILRVSRANLRHFSQSCVAKNELPSSPEMKSSGSWTGSEQSQKPESITSKVIGIAKSLQDNTKPPVEVDSAFTKKFHSSETYDPFDFSSDKLDIDRRLSRAKSSAINTTDPFERSGIDPLNLYVMPEILSRFLTSTGQILSREITGCNAENQKKLAIAIKRSRACGLLSSVHRHARFLPSRNM